MIQLEGHCWEHLPDYELSFAVLRMKLTLLQLRAQYWLADLSGEIENPRKYFRTLLLLNDAIQGIYMDSL